MDDDHRNLVPGIRQPEDTLTRNAEWR
jgi:hypothetical protein